MRLGDRSDAELMRLARAGLAPAFAVLVHRHAPSVWTAVEGAEDPETATATVFVRAMEQLPQRDVEAPLAPWFATLAGSPTVPAQTPLAEEQLDAIWRRLHERWPDGRPPRRSVTWRPAGVVALLAAVAAIVPALVLGTDTALPEDELEELRAEPVEDEADDEVGVAEEPPEFSFPVGPEEEAGPTPEDPPDPAPAAPGPPEQEPPPPDEGAQDDAGTDDETPDDETPDDGDGDERPEDEDDSDPLDDLLDGGDE